MTGSPSRREILEAAGSCLVALLAPGCVVADDTADTGNGPDTVDSGPEPLRRFEQRLVAVGPLALAWFRDGAPATIAEVGDAWLDVVASRRTIRQLRAALNDAVARLEASPLSDAVLEALRADVTSEFAALDVRDLDGWTLSPTELALAAIVALTLPSALPQRR